jgi:hypothetical protein
VGTPAGSALLQEPSLRVLPADDTQLTVVEGDATDHELELVVGNGGREELEWRARSEASWIRLAPETGTLAPRKRNKVRGKLDGEGLGALTVGRHVFTIEFENVTSGAVEATRRVVVLVRGERGLVVSPEEELRVDGETTQEYTLRNDGNGAIQWRSRGSDPWMRAEPGEGTLEPGAETTVSVRVDPSRPSRDAGAGPARRRGAILFHNRTDGVGSTLRTVVRAGESETTPAWRETDGGESDVARDTERSSVSQFGITWTFDRAYELGRFANGDYWVVGPVLVVGIDPPSVKVAGRTRNGSMLNPKAGSDMTQGYDSACYAKYGTKSSYSPRLNAALDVSPLRPLLLSTHTSLVSSISVPQPGARPQLQTAAILTVLDEAPPPGSFRPPYCGDDKTIRFRRDQLDTSLLASLAPVRGAPSLREVERKFSRPWIDHVEGWIGRYLHPAANMPDYGREITDHVSTGALMLHLNFPVEQKMRLLIGYVQLGIDLYGILENGGRWPPAAGHLNGRKWPILFAGLVLGDEKMQNIGFEYPPEAFSEDGQTFYVEAPRPELGYTEEHVGMAEWGTSHIGRPELDDVRWLHSESFPRGASKNDLRTQGIKYRLCCTANTFWGELLAARIMGAVELWNHDALFDYQDRFYEKNLKLNVSDYRMSWQPFYYEMWRRYRPAY